MGEKGHQGEMENIQSHYGQLLGIQAPWKVEQVNLDLGACKVDISVGHERAARFACPHCGRVCKLHDHLEQRSWRHLDTMQFETRIHCKSPRVKCEEHGVVNAGVIFFNAFQIGSFFKSVFVVILVKLL